MKLLEVFKNPVLAILAGSFALLFFDLNYYFMSSLPGHVDNMCVVGGNFTVVNVVFAVVMSVLSGWMVSAGVALYRRRVGDARVSLLGGAGVLVGTFTVFCTTCSLPVISLFGLSIGLTAFTDFNIWFKGLSVVLMLWGMWMLEKQLAGECKICKT